MPSVDLTGKASPYSVYIPSMQIGSAENIVSTNSGWGSASLPAGLAPRDFNYLDTANRFWTYKYALASAETFRASTRNAVTARSAQSFVLGDSGGFQIGKGTGEAARWRGFDEPRVTSAWRMSTLREEITRWCEMHCDYAMTLDLPLWTLRPANKGSPFNRCSVNTLIQLSVENLQYLTNVRGKWSSGAKKCKYLNVLQGDRIADENHWFAAVRGYKFDGWSFAGGVGTNGGPYRTLRRLLLLRDDKLLDPGFDWVHLLMLTAFPWAPLITAMQNGVRATANPAFTISYDSSTAYMLAGRDEKYFASRPLTTDRTTWTNPPHKFPSTYGFANALAKVPLNTVNCQGAQCLMCAQGQQHLPAPFGTPIASLLSIGDLAPGKGAFVRRRASKLCDETLINHNVYTIVDATIRANEAVFGVTPCAPQEIIDAVGEIGRIFQASDWRPLLNQNRALLERAAGFKAAKHVL